MSDNPYLSVLNESDLLRLEVEILKLNMIVSKSDSNSVFKKN